MSRDLERTVVELERKAQNKAVAIRRVVQEYNETVRSDGGSNSAGRLKKQREIERVVAQYAQIHKALKHLRKKMRIRK